MFGSRQLAKMGMRFSTFVAAVKSSIISSTVNYSKLFAVAGGIHGMVRTRGQEHDCKARQSGNLFLVLHSGVVKDRIALAIARICIKVLAL